jgi:hypothetical protein
LSEEGRGRRSLEEERKNAHLERREHKICEEAHSWKRVHKLRGEAHLEKGFTNKEKGCTSKEEQAHKSKKEGIKKGGALIPRSTRTSRRIFIVKLEICCCFKLGSSSLFLCCNISLRLRNKFSLQLVLPMGFFPGSC